VYRAACERRETLADGAKAAFPFYSYRQIPIASFSQSRVRADVPISVNSVWLACRQAAQAAGISKRISPDSLRHYSASRTITG
jgi:hypothetical protein